jgi:hypothetical protein
MHSKRQALLSITKHPIERARHGDVVRRKIDDMRTGLSVTAVIFLCVSSLFGAQVVSAESNRSSEAPIEVTVCQLETHPADYDRKLVEVRGRIYFGKFDFFIDATCEPHSGSRVWLDLGGDVLSPAASWGVSPSLPKSKGVDAELNGLALPLVRDALLDQFVNDVAAVRPRKPNGSGCGSECLFYEVTAMLKGRFFARSGTGFGMEECCSLLVIEQVEKLSSKRTTVPAGGQFQCTSDRWHPSPEELKAFSEIPGCSLRDDFKNCYPVLAKHWGDDIKTTDGLDNPGPWISKDMMVSYYFTGGFISKAGQPSEMTPSSSVIREACHPVSPAKPPSDHVYCEYHRAYWAEDRAAGIALRDKVAAGSETWRSSDMARVGWLAYEEASKKWNLAVPAEVELAKCEPLPAGPDGNGGEAQTAYCTWYSKDDMQQITVTLRKPGYLTKFGDEIQKAPWIALELEANLCRTAELH